MNVLIDDIIITTSFFQIQHIFEETYQDRAGLYEAAGLKGKPVGCVSADHTFKIGKNVSGLREIDEKLVRDKNKLFLVLDATQHVVNWTKSVGHAEIKEALSEVID